MQSALAFSTPMEDAIEQIHAATAIFTREPTIQRLLDAVGWPDCGGLLLDPGLGHADFLLLAIERLDPPCDDVAALTARVAGWEFHPGAVMVSRRRVAELLVARGWARFSAQRAAECVVVQRDFLLDPPAAGSFDVIVGNPPYARVAGIPHAYRTEFERAIDPVAQADLMHAYLVRCEAALAPGHGSIGFVTSDRWLINDTCGALRGRLAQTLRLRSIMRLSSESAFYRPKLKKAGTPARVTPVEFVLDRGVCDQLGAAPLRIEARDTARRARRVRPWGEGLPTLGELAKVSLGPWLGPEGIFVVDADEPDMPPGRWLPAVHCKDIRAERVGTRAGRRRGYPSMRDTLGEPRRLVLATLPGEVPAPETVEWLARRRIEKKMPKRGMRGAPWVPPESFSHWLPLAEEAVILPQIANRMRPTRLPVGIVPVKHTIIVVTGLPSQEVIDYFHRPEVNAWVRAHSKAIEGGYFATGPVVLRRLPVPERWKEFAAAAKR